MQKIAIISAMLLVVPLVALAAPIPDTGQTQCYDYTQEITCPNSGEPFYGQDAQYPRNPQSYTKLDASGNPLPDDAPWPWSMVRDNVTGLIWEVKTDDSSIHNRARRYTWAGAMEFGTTLNTAEFGGYSDWRLPTIKELSSIVNGSTYSPAIDTAYFRNARPAWHWSSTTYANDPSDAWSVYFAYGGVHSSVKIDRYDVRAVRGGQWESNNFIDNGDGTVTDTETGLMWEVKTDDGGPRDKDNYYTWQQALSYCENLTLAGYNDWRLPNRNELQSIVDYNRSNPSIDPIFTNTVSSSYRSSTTYAVYPLSDWGVYFADGDMHNISKSYNKYVRAVRAGGSLVDWDTDGILDDGDNSGTPGDNPCTGGQTENCDDNCLKHYNPDQQDTDGEEVGDACDNCPEVYNPNQEDTDGSGIGDACNDTLDADGDEWEDSLDNCPEVYNPNQEDTDNDSYGNACDNCPNVSNEDQADSDGDGIGNACDNCPNDYDNDIDSDSLCGDIDNCPTIPNGPDKGTCIWGTKVGAACTLAGFNPMQCGSDGFCSMNQEDLYPPQGNGIGDACDCECDFTCDGDVDAEDVTEFLNHFGRGLYDRPCESGDTCSGDFTCDGDVDGEDVTKFMEDFGRGQYSNPCPQCDGSVWCSY